MKAAQYKTYGGPEVIEINDAPEPTVGKEQILVRVYAAGVNPFDWKLRTGYMKDMVELKFPVTMGGDFSGVVVKAGENITDFKIGDEVYGQALILNGGSGSIAEFAVANVKNTARKPQNINHIESASLPLVGSSALQALEQHIGLKSGQKILINGGSGGIGSLAIQLAKSIGAYVATTVSTEHVEFAKKLGTDVAVDYKNENVIDKIKGFDAVFDTAGGQSRDNAVKVLKRGGIIVSMNGVPDQKLLEEYGVRGIGQSTSVSRDKLIRLAELAEQGIVKPQVDKVFPLEQTREAFIYQEISHPKGKVVISVK